MTINVKAFIPQLRENAITASKNAYSPYYKVLVGSAVLTQNEEIYSGCNIENSSYGATVCAERVAIFKAISEKKVNIAALYVYTDEGWPPCGMCRQVLSEFASNETLIIIGNKNGEEKISTLKELFPNAFTPKYL